ncbi:MAG: DUF4491 family protein [Anaerolineales bacterium]|nr:DUF4491 family protein [Anaerolineales bacterium]
MNWIGLVAAITAFLSIWIGHVAVRKIESTSRAIWVPTVVAIVIGILLEYFSLITENMALKTALGIIGITLLWDALEFTRQQHRIKKGHAPANPNNPRHAKILAEHPSATTLALLNRDPIGKPVSQAEAISLIAKH